MQGPQGVLAVDLRVDGRSTLECPDRQQRRNFSIPAPPPGARAPGGAAESERASGLLTGRRAGPLTARGSAPGQTE
eukprot:4697530-Pyramimonas_sp.AAC.1